MKAILENKSCDEQQVANLRKITIILSDDIEFTIKAHPSIPDVLIINKSYCKSWDSSIKIKPRASNEIQIG